jgi:PPOX class probable F420-dependent enzyme
VTKQRDLIRMSPEEVEAFLHERQTMAMATMGPDGRPHLVAMWYGFLDGAPAIETYRKSQKVLNLRRDPRITCLVENGDTYDTLRGVELVGTAEIVEDPDVVLEVARDVVSRYHDLPPEAAGELAAAMARKRVAVKVNVERVVSWDHSKLGLPSLG